MWLISLRDLQWRRRRFAIAVLASGLAFGLTLVMTGVIDGMRNESTRTVALYDADGWVVPDGATGPFTSTQLLPGPTAAEVAALPGVAAASPLLVARATIDGRDANIIGYVPGGPLEPRRLTGGTAPPGRGAAIADEALGVDPGATIVVGGRAVTVAATTSGTSFYFGTPTVFLPIGDVQDALFAGQDVATTVVVRGELGTVPDRLDVLSNEAVHRDLDRILTSTAQTLDIVNVLLRIMAVGTIAAMVYVSVLERLREFAVLKATGAAGRSLVGGLVLQACLLAVAAAAVGAGLAQLIAPTFAFAVEIPTGAYLQLLAVALVVGSLASAVGLRRVLRIDPALSFGGA